MPGIVNNNASDPVLLRADSGNFPVLQDDEIHLWRIAVDAAAPRLDFLFETLSEDERTRVRRYHFQKDKIRFAATRGLLRVILGRYLSSEPRRIHFNYNPYGKPFVGDSENTEGLQFNCSHAGNLAYIAVNRYRKIGVDIEHTEARVEMELIAERHFTREEVAEVKNYSADQRRTLLWELWTCKEAFVKALGEGLSFPLNEFDISAAVKCQVSKVRLSGARQWSIMKISLHPGYVGALAVEGEAGKTICHDAVKLCL